MLPWEAASYSPALYCSTIGADGLNFSVRNGKRWIPAAITTLCYMEFNNSPLPIEFYFYFMIVLVLLFPAFSTDCC